MVSVAQRNLWSGVAASFSLLGKVANRCGCAAPRRFAAGALATLTVYITEQDTLLVLSHVSGVSGKFSDWDRKVAHGRYGSPSPLVCRFQRAS